MAAEDESDADKTIRQFNVKDNEYRLYLKPLKDSILTMVRTIKYRKKSDFLDHLKQSEKQTDTFELKKVTKKEFIAINEDTPTTLSKKSTPAASSK